jgi:hypothetical protein
MSNLLEGSIFNEFTLNRKIYVENNSTLKVCGKTLSSSTCQMGFPSCIGDVLYVPKLAKNLLSIKQLIEKNFKVEFKTAKYLLMFFYSNKVIIEVVQDRRLYNLVKIAQSLVWLQNVTPRLRKMICGIRNLNMFTCKL